MFFYSIIHSFVCSICSFSSYSIFMYYILVVLSLFFRNRGLWRPASVFSMWCDVNIIINISLEYSSYHHQLNSCNMELDTGNNQDEFYVHSDSFGMHMHLEQTWFEVCLPFRFFLYKMLLGWVCTNHAPAASAAPASFRTTHMTHWHTGRTGLNVQHAPAVKPPKDW